MTAHEGGCLCGAVRYATDAPPLWVTICFCRFCQRATGSTGMVEPIFTRPDHRVIHGTPTTFNMPSGGSGKRITINFCRVCGTKLFLEFERFPDVIGTYAGTFDNPNWFERTPANTKYIFLEAAQSGTMVPPGFNAFHEHALLNDGTPIPPEVHDSVHVIQRP